MASRDTRKRSFPLASSCANSVMAGTLLDRSRRPRQLRGPAELALDFLDELADLGSGGFRLLPLDADERGLVLLIIEENVENAVGQQCEADDRDE